LSCFSCAYVRPWYDFRNPARWRQAPGRLYRETIDQAVWAEGLGFGSAWISEHHFSEDDYASSPLTIAAAIGARTSSMRVGTNIIVAALHDPVRLAEDATALSVMTGGRFELGVGLGYHETEFTAFGRQVRQRPSLLEDSIAVIRRAWSGSAERYEGKRFSSPGLPVTPVPETVPRLLTGAQSEPGIDRAARLGDGVITFVQRALRLVRRRAGTPWPPLRGWPGLRQSVGNRRRRPGAGMGRGR
jgi:alkanesulfonate monooxygenase SsuD/methylene tetrahydromethanopterin reductase-like flavin-dependent oxidoreductase (luciferase family)